MCRHAAAVGPQMPLSAVLFDGPHNLDHQSHQARELLTGTVCADGFAVAWYDADVRPEPARYARASPIWSDGDLEAFASLVHGRCMVAAIRNGTLAGANHEANCAPFLSGRHVLSHNGYLDRWSQVWQDEVLGWIAPERRRQIRGSTDSEHLFQALLSHLDTLDPEPGALANATRWLLEQVARHAKGNGAKAQVNLLIADGTQLVATRWSTAAPTNSLYLAVDPASHPDAVLVASEPFDDDGAWHPVDPGTLLVLQAGAPPVRIRC